MKSEKKLQDVKKDAETEIERLKFMLASSPAVTYVCEAFGVYADTFISDNITEVLGYQPSDFLDNPGLWADLIHPDDKEKILYGLKSLFENDYHIHEYRFQHKDGSYRWMHDELKLIRDADGEPLEMIGSWTDITDRKQAETELHDTQFALEHLLNTSAAMFYRCDPSGDYPATFISENVSNFLGYDSSEFVNDPRFWAEHIHPADAPRVFEELPSLFENGHHIHEYRFLHKNGSYRWMFDHLMLIKDKEGNPKDIIGTFIDITDRKKIEEALLKSENRFRELAENIREVFWVFDWQKQQVLYVSPIYEEVWGRSSKDLLDDYGEWAQSIHPDDQEYANESFQQILESESGESREYRIVRPDGTVRWILDRGFSICDNDGAVKRIVGIAEDITERKLAEKKIQESEEYIRNILDTVDEGFIVIDRDYRIMTANKAYCDQVSLPSEKVLGRHCYEISHQSERPCFEVGEECAVRQVFATGKPHMSVHKHLTWDGEIIYVETKAFPNIDGTGKVVSVLETVRNITERYLLEAEQLKTQKLEAVGTLAGGIAHDFNNLLQGLFGNISMAKIYADQPGKVSEFLDQAEKSLSMSVNLTNQLLTFAKGGKPVRTKTDIKPLIEDISKFALSGSKCDCRLTIAQDLWHAEADEGQIGQVIQNIVLNASEAMPDGGKIDISAENLELSKKHNVQLPDGGKFIKVVIKDTGIGIPKKHLEKIFDPYFTTKQKGSGLGLATSYSIIKNHKGTIEVISKPEKGTTFLIYIPATETITEESVQASETSATRECRILVMDDEELVLNIAKTMIKTLGHEVEVSADGESAIEKYRQALGSKNPFDIVILDLTIKGGMGGEEAVKRLLEIDPSVTAIVSSGYSDNPVLSDFHAHGFSAVLAKPFSLRELRECLNKFVNQGSCHQS